MAFEDNPGLGDKNKFFNVFRNQDDARDVQGVRDDFSLPGQADFLKTRVYLYKYTPPFTKNPSKRNDSKRSDVFLNTNSTEESRSKLLTDRFAKLRNFNDELLQIKDAVNFMLSVYGGTGNTLLPVPSNPTPLKFPEFIAGAKGNAPALTLTFWDWVKKIQSRYVLTGEDRFTILPITVASELEELALNRLKVGDPGPPALLLDFPNPSITTSAEATIFFLALTNDLRLVNNWLLRVFNVIDTQLRIVDRSATEAKLIKESNLRKATETTTRVFKIDRFSFPLDEGFFTRFDISRYVTQYSTTHALPTGHISWQVNLSDSVVSFRDLDVNAPDSVRRRVFFPDPNDEIQYRDSVPSSIKSADELIARMAEFESDDVNNFELDVTRVEIAMRLRGISDLTLRTGLQDMFSTGVINDVVKKRLDEIESTPAGTAADNSIVAAISGSLSDQIKFLKAIVDQGVDGIRLSDLVQKYDFISAFAYSHPVSPDIVESVFLQQDDFFFDKEANFMSFRPRKVTTAEGSDEGKQEDPNKAAVPIYEPDFNGFVIDKSQTEAARQFNILSLSGNGSLGLFGATRVIYSPTIYQSSIYDYAEIMGQQDFTVLENLFQNKDPFRIIAILLEVYQIMTFEKKTTQGAPNVDEKTPRGEINGDRITDNGQQSSLIDIDRIKELGFNEGQDPRMMFIIPVFLYANVMRQRQFNVRAPRPTPFIGDNAQFFSKKADGVGGSVLETDPNVVNKFTPYFEYLKKSLKDYTPDRKTPWEIVKDVRASSYLEFFETPGGRIIFRTPQYNNTIPEGRIDTVDENGNRVSTRDQGTGSATDQDAAGTMVFSDQINIIATSYTSTIKNLWTKLQLGYGADFIGQILPILYYHYTNGKLLAQYGLFMSQVQANPNVRITPNKFELNRFYEGVFEYCRFFLEYHNMSLRQGTIRAAGSSEVRIGNTYYDIQNQKFGYVTKITKTLVVGGNYTMNITLDAVRDAVSDTIIEGELHGRPLIKELPELEEILKRFEGAATRLTRKGAQQRSARQPDRRVLNQIQEQRLGRELTSGESTNPLLVNPTQEFREAVGINEAIRRVKKAPDNIKDIYNAVRNYFFPNTVSQNLGTRFDPPETPKSKIVTTEELLGGP